MNNKHSLKVLGLDAHISTCDFGIVDRNGQIIYRNCVITSAKNLIEEVKCIPGPKVIVIEEGCMASWLIRTLKPYCEKIVASDPKRNSWIAKDNYKDDHIDAPKLSQLYQGGFINEIYHTEEIKREAFKETVYFYHDLVKSQTRLKNKIKANFRQNGIQCKGTTIYKPDNQNKWLDRIDHLSHVRWKTTLLLDRLMMVQKQIKMTKQQLQKYSRQFPEIPRFKKIDGIDLINACTISAIIDTPFRFPNKRKLWTYSGFGLTDKGSGGKKAPKHLNKSCNKLLKATIKRTVESAIIAKDNKFKIQYQTLVYEKGILPHRAKLTIARSMLATIYALWSNQTDYVEPSPN
jgi:transposase